MHQKGVYTYPFPINEGVKPFWNTRDDSSSRQCLPVKEHHILRSLNYLGGDHLRVHSLLLQH